jgi:protein-S-isoprenylcysteine O-methyltransferase Ste14
MKFTPPDYFLVVVVLQILLNYLFPIERIIFSPYTYIGIPLIIFGIYLNWFYVYRIFRKAKTPIDVYKEPKVLIVSGFFRISRNPTYLGMFLTLLGVAILLGSIVAFVFPILFFILTNHFTIPIEEKNLEKKFEKKYMDYKKKVRRWL